jgi:hypothetical protein
LSEQTSHNLVEDDFKPELLPEIKLDFTEQSYPKDINAFVHPDLKVSAEQEAAFAAHVAYVDQKGDLGKIPTIKSPTLGVFPRGRGAAMTFGIAATEVGLPIAGATTPTTLALGGILGAAAITYHQIKYHKHDLRHARKVLDKAAQQELGERYELYKVPGTRDNPPRILMRYYGEIEDEGATAGPEEAVRPVTPLDRIQRMAVLAEQNGIDGIVLSHPMMEAAVGKEKADIYLGEKPHSAGSLVNANIHRQLASEKVAVHAPQHWIDEENEAKHTDYEEKTKAAVKVLQTLNPDDKTALVFDYFDGDERQARYTRQAAQQFAASELTDRTPAPRHSSTEETAETDTVERRDLQQTWEAQFSGNDIIWESRGLRRKVSLETYLHLTPIDMLDILKYPEQDPTKARILAQAIAAGATIPGFGSTAETTKEKAAPLHDASRERPLYDDMLTDQKDGRWGEADGIYQPVQYKMLASLMFGTLLATSYLGGALGLQASLLKNATDADIYDIRADLDAKKVKYSAEDVLQRLAAESPVSYAWYNLQDTIPTLDPWHHTPEATPPPPEETTGKDAFERNDQPVVSEWDISAHGNIGVTGHWAVSTYSTLNIDTFNWTANTELNTKLKPVELPMSPAPDGKPSIEVSRYLSSGDRMIGTNLIRIPVLEGTKPVAASLDGRPVKLRALEGGTYVLEVNGQVDQSRLTFWLENAKYHATPHATRVPIATKGGFGLPAGAVDDVWARFIPGYKELNAHDRFEKVVDYVQTNFKYRLDNKYNKYDADSDPLVGITQSILEKGTGNCYYSAALELTSTMSGKDPYGLGGGFLVQDPDARQLSSRALHAWALDQFGTQDGTPYKDILPADGAWLREKPQNGNQPKIAGASSSGTESNLNPFVAEKPPAPKAPEPLPIWPMSIPPLALTAAGMVLVNRRNLAESRRRLGEAYNNWWLKHNPEATHTASEVIDAARWDPERDILEAIARVRKPTSGKNPLAIDVTNVVDKLIRPENHGDDLEPLFDAALAESPHKEYTWTIKDARRAVRKARWLYEHPRPDNRKKKLERTDDETGQLQL